MNEENINEESINEENINEESINEESINEESINEESINEENISEENINKENIKYIKPRQKKNKSYIKLLCFVLLCVGLYFFMSSSMFDVKEFVVEGNNYYTDAEIMVMGNCKLGENIFWGTDYKDIKNRLKNDAYMEEVKVKRVLPDKVSIKLKERTQLAAVVYGEKYIVIDGDGTVLRKTGVEPKVTLIRGLTISKLEVGEKIEVEQTVLLRQALELINTMREGNMYFKEIQISKGRIKAYILDNLICSGTPENIMQAINSNNLQLVVKELFDKKIERGTIKVTGKDYVSFTPKID